MKPSLLKVLNLLRQNKRKGITYDNFPKGTELRKRLMELRVSGYKLIWNWELQDNGGRHKRWFLLGEPK